jgi:hypothetical protein
MRLVLTITQSKLERLSARAHDYKTLLEQLQPRVNAEDARLISNVLKKVR